MIDGEGIGKVMLSTTIDTASHKVRSKVACAALVCTRIARAALLSQFAEVVERRFECRLGLIRPSLTEAGYLPMRTST